MTAIVCFSEFLCGVGKFGGLPLVAPCPVVASHLEMTHPGLWGMEDSTGLGRSQSEWEK